MDRRIASVAACALTLGLASCGSSNAPLTRAEFVRQADAVCKQARARADAEARKHQSPAATSARLVALQRDISGGLGKLTPPTNLSSTFVVYKRGLDVRQRLLDQLLAAFRAGRHDQMAALGRQAQALDTRQKRETTALGLKVCS